MKGMFIQKLGKFRVFKIILLGMILIKASVSYSQNLKSFTVQYNESLRGDMLMIGNNILNRYQPYVPPVYNHKGKLITPAIPEAFPTEAYNGTDLNSEFTMNYIDIDPSTGRFNSSSADLTVADTTCIKIKYAKLCWGALLQSGNRTDINKVKLKLPGTANYVDITGTVIYDANATPVDGNKPYAASADVTALLAAQKNPWGTYTVANVVTSQGTNGVTGLSAGWSLFVVYENPKMPAKYITSFEGFSGIFRDTGTLNIPISGFKTIPTGPVRASLAFSALEGDLNYNGDYLLVNPSSNTTKSSSPARPSDNFFNSTITNLNGIAPGRNPASTNTLGFDTGIIEINNPSNTVIKNGDTSATIRLGTNLDTYFYFFNAFAVDIIEPKIELIKHVKDKQGNDVSNKTVGLGEELYYEVTYQNIGNDAAKNVVLKDIIPVNTSLKVADIDLSNAGGATIKSYNSATRTLLIDIPENSVEVGDPVFTIRFKVKVADSCLDLTDACSNNITNQADVSYEGKLSKVVVSDALSFSSSSVCKIGVPSPTNFLGNVTGCNYNRTQVLCHDSVVLTASSGYTSYSWSNNPSGTPVLATTKSITVTSLGTYYCTETAVAPCVSITEQFEVVPFGPTVTNPVIPFADDVKTCPDDGKQLPEIYLCGLNATKSIATNVNDGSTIVWQKLDESSCTAVSNSACANESNSCTWVTVGNGPTYVANASGQYRMVLNYQGGCFNRFYFNVYKNLLDPNETHQDIVCNSPGKITVGGVPLGYQYSLDNVNWQTGNEFIITSPDIYTVYIKQIGVDSNPCLFTIPGIPVRKRDFTVTTTAIAPLCNGGKGGIKLAANDALPQYYFKVSQGASVMGSVGPIAASDYTFSNLNVGSYTVEVSTDDGCLYTETVVVNDTPLLTASASVTKPLTCEEGEITITPQGGTEPYVYYVNSTTEFDAYPIIAVSRTTLPVNGVYDIEVVDYNNCRTNTSVTVTDNPAPVFGVISTNIACAGSKGRIDFNVTQPNGYTLAYSIDGGTTYSPSPSFLNLSAGSYEAILRYSMNYSMGVTDCFSVVTPLTITEPTAVLSASAGVSELAGCGSSGEGKIRITNPQGGQIPYTYSFDGGITYVASNELYVNPGTYNLSIKDALGCVFSMPAVTLDSAPPAPTITIDEPIFNCNGTANTTVTVNNNGSNYDYTYKLDGNVNNNVPANVFNNVGSGVHTITIDYHLTSVSTYSNLLNEDFGSGTPTTTPGIASAYCFNDQRVVGPYPCDTRSVEDNQYSVAKDFWRPDDPSSNNSGAWYHFKDHTTNGTDTNGRFLIVNIGSAAGPYGVLYSKPIADVVPNQPVKVDLYLGNLLRNHINAANPDFIIELVDPSGVVVASQNTGIIPNNEIWNLKSVSLNPGNNTNLTFKIRSGSTAYNGNDAVIDDISVYQIPKACITTKDFPFVVDSTQAFAAQVASAQNAKCSNTNDGTITIMAQNFDTVAGFEYSINNGVTWVNSKISPVIINGLTAGNYTPLVRYNTAGACTLTLEPQTILNPPVLGVSATITSLANCHTGATIAVTATGGVPAYQYQLLDKNTGVIVKAFQPGNVFTNVAQGDYTVVVNDVNVCSNLVPVNITVEPIAVITASISPSSNLCYNPATGATIVINATGGNGALQYRINGGTWQSSNTFSNLAVNSYTVDVQDVNGCSVTIVPTVVITPALTFSSTTGKPLDCSVSPDAEIIGTIGYGYPDYSYRVQDPTATWSAPVSLGVGVNAFNYSAATPGDYVFEVTDSNGCKLTSPIHTVDSKLVPVANATKTDVTCKDANNGTITINTPPIGSGFQYGINKDVDNVSAVIFGSAQIFSDLSPGTYYYYIKDGVSLCVGSASITITEPVDELTVSVNTPELSCNPSTNIKQSATVTLTAGGGTPAYQYSFNGAAFGTDNFYTVNDNGSDQYVSYVVRDTNGCLTTVNGLTITKLDPPTDLDFSNAAITCSAPTTTVQVEIPAGKGGVAPLIFTNVNSGITNSTGDFAGLLPGVYEFKVTDANGCYYTESYEVKSVTNITVSGVKQKDVSCNGLADGAIEYTVSDFSGTYKYSLNGAAAVIGLSSTIVNATALSPATYTMVVTDEVTGCTATSTPIVISQPAPLTVTAAATKVYCSNYNSQITISQAGGTPVYSYAVAVNGVTPTYGVSNVLTVDTNSGQDLTWNVYVQDAKGCVSVESISITANDIPTIVAPLSQCYMGVSLTIGISGTTYNASAQYSIGGGYQSSPVFSNVLTPGTYTLTIKDDNNCVATTTYKVNPQLILNAVLTKDLDCTLFPNAEINLTASGGSETGYIYSVSSDGGATYNPVMGSVFSTPDSGSYIFKVNDNQNPPVGGCSIVRTPPIVVTPVTSDIMSITATLTPVSCNGLSDGTITVTPSGGLAPYTYSIKSVGDSNPFTYQSSNLFTGLLAGDYLVSIKDNKDCEIESPVTVTVIEPSALTETHTVIPFSCNASNAKVAGTITITPSGGNAPYQYSFNGGSFDNSNVFSLNDNGSDQTIPYVVRDSKDCTVSGTYTFTQLNPPTDLNITGTLINCAPLATTSTVTLVVPVTAGGVFPLNYTLIAPVVGVSQTSNVFNGLSDAIYTFKVTDATGCYYTKSYEVEPLVQIKMTSKILNGVLCNGDDTGVIEYTVTDYIGGFTITTPIAGVTPVISGNKITVSGLPAGNYTLGVTDNTTSCVASITDTITEPAAIEISGATVTATHVHCNNYFSTLTVTGITGGILPYSYAAVVAGSAVPTTFIPSNVINVDTDSGNILSWDVYVKDANGCISLPIGVIVTLEAAPTVSVDVNQCTATSNVFTITANPGASLTPVYSIDGINYQSNNDFTVVPVAPVTYTIYLKDKNGCVATENQIVYPYLTVSANFDKDITCSAPTDASVTVTATGGSGNYGYYVSVNGASYTQVPANSNNYITATAGNYIFKVIDTVTNCENIISTTYTVTTPVAPVLAVTVTAEPLCNGEATGSLKSTVTSGTAPFTYSLNGGLTQQLSNVFSGLIAGTYTVTVTDAKGCTATQTPLITQPNPLSYALVAISIKCSGISGTTLGSIEVQNLSGGIPDYTYSLKNFNGYTVPADITTNVAPPPYTGLNFGTYELSVVDANNCTLKQQVLVSSPPDGMTITALTPVGCNTDVEVVADGPVLSTGPFWFTLYTDPYPNPDPDSNLLTPPDSPPYIQGQGVGSRTAVFSDLIPGVLYSFIVYDQSTGCSYIDSTKIEYISSTTIKEVRIVTPVTCKGSSDGTVRFTVSDFPTDVTSIEYQVFDELTNVEITGKSGTMVVSGISVTDIVSGLDKGKYYIVYTYVGGPQSNGCKTGTTPFEIYESAIEFSVTASVVKNDNCNEKAGVISAVAKGGTAPYTYQIIAGTDTTTAPDMNDSNWDIPNTFNVENGNWVVWAKDAYNCIQAIINPLTVTEDSSPDITATPVNLCALEGNFEITVDNVTGISPYQISLDGAAFQPVTVFPLTLTNINSGTHTITVIDVNGCSDSATVIILKPIVASADLTSDLTCSSGAVLKVTATEGYPAYTYEYLKGAVVLGTGISDTYTTLVDPSEAGNYSFRVTDVKGCSTTTNLVTVTAPLSPTITVTNVTNVSCNGLSDGTVLVNGASGLAPYEYILDGTTWQTSNLFTGLAAGSYTIKIRDSKDCEATTSATVTQPDVLAAVLTVSKDFKCGPNNTLQNAEVTVIATDGTSPYMYSYDNGNTYVSSDTNNVSGVTGLSSTANALVKDAHGCNLSAAATVTVPALNPPTALTFTQGISITCISATTDITLTVTDADMPLSALYRYEIVAPVAGVSQASNVFTSLLPDNYLFKVTDEDGCVFSDSYLVKPVNPIIVDRLKLKDVSCFNDNDGALQFTVSGYSGTYKYSLNGAAEVTGISDVNINVSPLAPMAYTMVVTDEVTGCSSTSTSITINEPSALAIMAVSATNINCNNANSQITITVTGGTSNYKYAVAESGITPTTFSTSNVVTVSAVSGTVLDVHVVDFNGCTTTTSVTVLQDALPTIVTPLSQCYTGIPLDITLSGTTYNGVAQYSIGGAYQNDPLFLSQLDPGTYTLSIKDDHDCMASVNYEVKPQLNLNAKLDKDLDCTILPGAEIILTASGGMGTGYTYEFNKDNSGFVSMVNPLTLAGSYTFRVTDSQSCDAVTVGAITVTDVTTGTLSITPTVTNVSCKNGSDGTITVIASGGVAPYEYELLDSTGLIVVRPYQKAEVFTGLPAGTYVIKIKDAKSCEIDGISNTVTINEPAVLGVSSALISFSCAAADSSQQPATVTLNGNGGTAPYQYSFNGGTYVAGSPTADFFVNNNGTDQIINFSILDANGCVANGTTFTINKLDPPTITAISTTKLEYCGVGNGATVEITTVNGVTPLTYEIIAPITGISQAGNVFTNLPAGNYTFRVTDANGCYFDKSHTVNPVKNIIVNGAKLNDVSCFGGSNGSVQFTVSNVNTVGNYNYTLTPNVGSITNTLNVVTVTGLSAGIYTLDVTDNVASCVNSVSVTVAQPSLVGLTATTTNVHCNKDISEITITATGGTPGYKYEAVVAGSSTPAISKTNSVLTVDTNSATNLVWDVYVQDQNGCTANTTVTVIQDPMPTVTISPISNVCNVAPAVSNIDVSATGVGPFQYSLNVVGLSPSNVFQTGTNFKVPVSGEYTVTVKDTNGCIANSATSVTVYDPVKVIAFASKEPSCGNSDGAITVAAVGGLSSYTYTINPVAGTLTGNVFTGLTFGSYDVTVTDANNCSDTVTVVLDEPTAITGLSATTTPVSCFGGNNGTLTVILPASNNNTPYQYALAGPVLRALQFGNSFTDLVAGTYDVTVVSGRGCSSTISVEVFSATPIVVAAPTVTQYNCNTGSNLANFATISVNPLSVTGGTANYVRYEFVRNGTEIVQDGANPVHTEYDYLGGNYTINVYDTNGCLGTISTAINPFVKIATPVVAVSSAINCISDEAIQVSVTVNPASPALVLNYSLTIGGVTQTNTTGSFTNLPIGDYLITVENPTTGCSVQTYHYVNNPNTFDLIANKKTDVICFGGTDGSVELTIKDLVLPDEAGAFNYAIMSASLVSPITGTTTGVGPITITGLPVGVYSVTATLVNNPYCELSKNFTINGPQSTLQINAVSSAITCVAGNADGTISLSASGGWNTSYEYKLEKDGVANNNWTTQIYYDALSQGTYVGYVRDIRGCEATVTVVLNNPTPIVFTATADKIQVKCFGDKDAAITVALPTGGQGANYLYTLNTTSVSPTLANGPQSSNVFTGLGEGTYTVTVTDSWGCGTTDLTPIEIGQPNRVMASLALKTGPTCATNPTVELTATGGTPGYTYSLDDVTYTGPLAPSHILDAAIPLPSENSYYVKDANDCEAFVSNSVYIEPLVELTLIINDANSKIACKGEATGVIVAKAQGGMGNYVYTLFDDSNNIVGVPTPAKNSQAEFKNLAAGTYKVSVTSADCTAVESIITINEPVTALTATVALTDVSCFGKNDGQVEITATGGTGTIKYAISPNLNSFDIYSAYKDLAPESYSVIAQDENGCFQYMKDLMISEPAVLGISATILQEDICTGDNAGKIRVDIEGGTKNYFTSFNSMEDTDFTEVLNGLSYTEYDGIAGGNQYPVFVKDANGCQAWTSVEMADAIDLQLDKIVTSVCGISNIPTQTITAVINKALTPADVQYSLDGINYQASNEFPGLTVGTYTLYAKHNDGCVKNILVDVVELYPVSATVTDIIPALCYGTPTGSITVSGSGGNGILQYGISPDIPPVFVMGTDNVFNDIYAGNYIVRVVDPIGCEVQLTNNIVTQSPELKVAVEGLSGSVCGDEGNASVTLKVEGGVTPYYTSMYSNANFVQDKFVYDNLDSGKNYSFFIKDSQGCTTDLNTQLGTSVAIDAVATLQSDCNQTTAIVNVNPAIATEVMYSINGGAFSTNNVFTNLQTQKYTVLVKHNTTGCTDSVVFYGENIAPVSLVLQESGLNEFTATAGGGSGIYTYTLNGEDKGSQNVYVITSSGTYTVTATDSKGCSITESIEIEYVPIEIPNSFTPNEDGHNDGWAPTNLDSYPNITVDIFDRYGRKVAVLTRTETWDGKYNGVPLPTGDYWYIINLGDSKDQKEIVGHFTLYR